MMTLTAADAAHLIETGRAPAGLSVSGTLDLSGAAIRTLPAGLSCYELILTGSDIETLPADINVTFRLDLSDCHRLRRLPYGLAVPSLVLTNCTRLTTLPEGLSVYYLDISGCVNLRRWPGAAQVSVGRFRARGCPQLTALPPWLTEISELDVAGCLNLTALPAGLRVSSWIDIGQTGLNHLPLGCRRAELRWHGVRIEPRVAFQPWTITTDEIVSERNIERRRVLLERMGYERFFEEVEADVLDSDYDPGGARQLLHVPIAGDEDLFCLRVQCPSTARSYLIRVPPQMESCHQAAAWIAGFDNPALYQPLVET